LQVLDICEYSIIRGTGDGYVADDVILPGEGVGECEMTVINQTEMAFETDGVNAGCVYQTMYSAYSLALTRCNSDATSRFLPMSSAPLQLTDYRSSFCFELAARTIGGVIGGDLLTFQVQVVDPFNSNTW
jgi:hypothetical protein